MVSGKRADVEHAAIRVRDIERHIRFFRDVVCMILQATGLAVVDTLAIDPRA